MHTVLNDVLIGKDFWLFSYQGTNAIHAILQGQKALNTEQIKNWQNNLQERKNFCMSLGSAYHFIIAPLKQCVYTDKLPDYPISSNRPAIQLSQNTIAKYPLKFFQSLKKINPCYYQYDTHWNNFGCNALYHTFLQHKSFSIPQEYYTQPLHDLWVKISKDPCPIERCWHYKQNNIIVYNEIENLGAFIFCENPHHKKHKAVIFGDSFTRFSINTISQHFSHVFFFHTTGFDKNIIEKIRPDTVINCHAENFIHTTDKIRFADFFEALLYKFLISEKNCILQQNMLKTYALFMPQEQILILQELILLFQKDFTQDKIIKYLSSTQKIDKNRSETILAYKKTP